MLIEGANSPKEHEGTGAQGHVLQRHCGLECNEWRLRIGDEDNRN